MASISYIPGGPDPNVEIGQKVQSLVQMGLQLEQQKKQDAQQTLEMGFKLMDLGIDPDYGKMTQAAKQLGYPLPNDTKQWQASRAQMTPTPGVNPNQAASTGGAMQGNKSGAASGTPVSTNAANKAPAGGMTQSAVPTQTVQKAVAGNLPAQQQSTSQPGTLQGYTESRRQAMSMASQAQAMTLEEQKMKLEKDRRMMSIGQKIDAGEKVSDFEMGEFFSWSTGQPLSLPLMEYLAADEKDKARMIDMAAGAESDADKNNRIQGTINTLVTSPQFADMYKYEDRVKAATAIANGLPVPPEIKARPDIRNMVEAANFTNQMLSHGIPFKYAGPMGEAFAAGGNPWGLLPTGVKSLEEIQGESELRRAAAAERQAGAAERSTDLQMAQLEVDFAQARIAAAKLAAVEQTEANKQVQDRLTTLIAGAKAGYVDQEVVKAAVNDAARIAGWEVREKDGFFRTIWKGIVGATEYVTPGASASEVGGMVGQMPGKSPQAGASHFTSRPQPAHTPKKEDKSMRIVGNFSVGDLGSSISEIGRRLNKPLTPEQQEEAKRAGFPNPR